MYSNTQYNPWVARQLHFNFKCGIEARDHHGPARLRFPFQFEMHPLAPKIRDNKTQAGFLTLISNEMFQFIGVKV